MRKFNGGNMSWFQQCFYDFWSASFIAIFYYFSIIVTREKKHKNVANLTTHSINSSYMQMEGLYTRNWNQYNRAFVAAIYIIILPIFQWI